MNFNLDEITEIKLSYVNPVLAKDRPKCPHSEAAWRLLYSWWNKDTIELYEEFAVLFLDRANRALGIYKVSQGGVTGTVADVRLVFAAALKARATAMVLAHNHPSGALLPSAADRRLTKRFVDAGRILNIAVIEHLIMVPDRDYYSFADNYGIDQP